MNVPPFLAPLCRILPPAAPGQKPDADLIMSVLLTAQVPPQLLSSLPPGSQVGGAVGGAVGGPVGGVGVGPPPSHAPPMGLGTVLGGGGPPGMGGGYMQQQQQGYMQQQQGHKRGIDYDSDDDRAGAGAGAAAGGGPNVFRQRQKMMRR